ncbi:hypothetical protein ACSU1N_04030 [Thermogladius sp. 4427co]|uniref:hypothetical protein n=1 Tax=Thermogladius sp. 4427co TaxID=3450718 RepID=UPI003F7ACA8F
MGGEESGGEDIYFLLEQLILRLDLLIRRLERVENILYNLGLLRGEEGEPAILVGLVKLPASLALYALARAWRVLARIGRADKVTEAVIYVLSDCKPRSITEIYRGVKELRGRASRRIVREKLRLLEASGLAVNRGSAKRPRYVLEDCRA